MPQHQIFRIIFQCYPIVFNRPVKIALTNTCQASYLISAHHKGVSLDRLVAIGFSALVIVQIYLRQSTKEIRLEQIGFRIDYLIEILYGEHIVLKIQSITGNGHHPFRIDLCIRQRGQHQKHSQYFSDHRRF